MQARFSPEKLRRYHSLINHAQATKDSLSYLPPRHVPRSMLMIYVAIINYASICISVLSSSPLANFFLQSQSILVHHLFQFCQNIFQKQ